MLPGDRRLIWERRSGVLAIRFSLAVCSAKVGERAKRKKEA